MLKVFLGGTYNSTWRDQLIPLLDIPYFNPYAAKTTNCKEEEIRQKNNHCKIHLYVIAKDVSIILPIAEAIESSMTKDKITIFNVIPEGFSEDQLSSLKAICDMITRHGGISIINNDFYKLSNTINYI